MSSVFQPTIDPARASVLGHDEHALSPGTLCSAKGDDQRAVALDRPG